MLLLFTVVHLPPDLFFLRTYHQCSCLSRTNVLPVVLHPLAVQWLLCGLLLASFDHYEHARSAGSISPPLRRLPCIPVYICLLWKPPSAFIWPPLRAPTFFVLLIADDLFSSEFLSFDSFHVFSFPFIVFFPFFFSIVLLFFDCFSILFHFLFVRFFLVNYFRGETLELLRILAVCQGLIRLILRVLKVFRGSIGCLRYTKILLGWDTYEYYYETVELPNPRPTQPKKN